MASPTNVSVTPEANYSKSLTVVTYNMHGFNQGVLELQSLCIAKKYDIVFIQEHWLTNDLLRNFDYF